MLAAGGVAAVLRVHQGNFKQVGFVERPALAPLAELCHAHGALLIEDLGGGALLDLTPFGLAGEPTVRSSVSAGADVVCFSTDKVLGGPQGGVIVGRAACVESARRDPLARALRLGRLPLVALEATLSCYLEGALDELPALAMLRTPPAAVRERAERWQAALAAEGVAARSWTSRQRSAAARWPRPRSPRRASRSPASDVEEGARRLRVGEPPVLASSTRAACSSTRGRCCPTRTRPCSAP